MNKILKRISAAVIALAVMFTAVFVFNISETVARAAGETSGSFGSGQNKGTWTYDTTTQILTVGGSIAIPDSNWDNSNNCSTAPWKDHINDIARVVIGKDIPSIGSANFKGCVNLQTVEFENGTKIILIDNSAFSGCTKLSNIILPETITKIGSSTFYNCTSLTQIEIPAGAQLGGGAFQNCTSLETVTFAGDIGLNLIVSQCFQNCTKLKNITIPNSVKTIVGRAFEGCADINLFIPNTVTTIRDNAFKDCVKIFYPSDRTDAIPDSCGAKSLIKCIPDGDGYKLEITVYDGYTGNIDLPEQINGKTIVGTNYKSLSNKITHEGDCRYDSHCTEQYKCAVCGKECGHTWNSGTVTTPATCTATGVKTITCTVCKQTKTETIPSSAHTLVTDAAVAATCTTAGKTEGKHCSVCKTVITAQATVPAKGHTIVTDAAVAATCTTAGKTEGKHCSVCNTVITAQTTVPANGHTWGAWTVKTPATETSKGEETRECSVCKTTESREIPVLAHTHSLAKHNRVEPDCTTAGNIEHWTCSGCGKSFRDENGTTEVTDTALPAKGHTEVTDAAVAATCTNTGLTAGSHCSVCNTVITAQTTVPANGHTWGEWTVKIPATEACKGEETRECSVCKTTESKEIPVLAHTHSLTKHNRVEPDCTTAGSIEYWTCSGCGKSFSDENGTAEVTDTAISAKGHTIVTDAAVAATCTTAGKTEGKHCSVCNAVITVQTTIPAKGHTWGAWTVKTPATETDKGEETRECSVCHTAESRDIPALNHKHTLVHVPEIPATETTEGEKEHWHCDGCGKDFFDEEGKQEANREELKIGKIETEVQAPANVPKPEIAISKEELIEAVLSADEQKKVDEGAFIKIILKVEDATNTVPAADKTAVTSELAKMSKYMLGQYLDVTMLKKIGEIEQAITNTNAPIRITFEIPTALRGNPEYSVIRIHEGTVTVLSDLDGDPNTVTIETDKFSIYALTYKEKTSSGGSGSGSGGSGGSGGGSSHRHRYIYDETIIKEPTCTESGEKTLSCSCGQTTTETIPALGHDYRGEITKPATETENGIRTFTCTRCGDSYTELIEKTGSESKPNDTSSNTSDNTSSGASDDTSSGVSTSDDTSSNSGDISSDNSGSSSDDSGTSSNSSSSSGGTGEDNPITGVAAVVPLMAVIAATAALAVTKSRKK